MVPDPKQSRTHPADADAVDGQYLTSKRDGDVDFYKMRTDGL